MSVFARPVFFHRRASSEFSPIYQVLPILAYRQLPQKRCASSITPNSAQQFGEPRASRPWLPSSEDDALEVECLESIAMSKRPIPNLEAASFVGKHSVAFLLPGQDAPGGVRLKASGSFVTFDNRYFVLTATHVWAALRESPVINCAGSHAQPADEVRGADLGLR